MTAGHGADGQARPSAPPAPPAGAVAIGPVTDADRDVLVALLGGMRVSLAGSMSRHVHALVASDAARGDRCVLALIARIGGTPAGFVVATMDTRSYWRAALRRRPAALLAVIAARLAQRRHRTRPSGDTPRSHTASVPAVSPPLAPAATAPLQWSVDAPDLAKIGFIGVLPEFRRQGVGEALYRALFAAAASRGGRAVLARIAADNVASLWLHHSAGWDLFRDDAGPFAVLTLPTTSSSS